MTISPSQIICMAVASSIEVYILPNLILTVCVFYFLQHRRATKLAAAFRYKNRVDAKKSLSRRRAEETKDLPQDPLDDLFDEPTESDS